MNESGDGERDDDDVVLLHSPNETGDGIRVVRKRQDTIELGELRPMREGQPIHGDVVRLTPREESALLFDCEVVLPSQTRKETPENKLPAPSASAAAPEPADEKKAAPKLPHKGPPRVTTDAYRGGWDAIFGKRPDKNNAPN